MQFTAGFAHITGLGLHYAHTALLMLHIPCFNSSLLHVSSLSAGVHCTDLPLYHSFSGPSASFSVSITVSSAQIGNLAHWLLGTLSVCSIDAAAVVGNADQLRAVDGPRRLMHRRLHDCPVTETSYGRTVTGARLCPPGAWGLSCVTRTANRDTQTAIGPLQQ